MNIDHGKREWTSEELDGLREAIEDAAKKAGFTQAEVGRRAEVAPSTLSQFMSATYPGKNAELATRLAKWLTAHNEAMEFREIAPPEPSFVQTPNAMQVWGAFQHAQLLNDTAVIVGPPGSGKTAAIDAYLARQPRAKLITGKPSISTASAVLGDFLNRYTGENGFAGRGLAAKSFIVRQHLTKGSLLIVDEAQHVSVGALEELRAIVDEQKCGMALVGNATVLRRLQGASRDVAYAQLFGRVGNRVELKKASPADVQAVLATMQVDAADVLKAATDILAKDDMRVVIKAVRKAILLAHGANENLDARFLKAAYRQLSGEGLKAA
ncbi:MAG: AAA family ATPase [Brevundimonas sp.]|uniref:AAA family ATPase n=1 Tax=Brevundimonas sp. TaxID=1871086 RepID=UPI001A20657C|nr:AAA family ATPase [Brevundimonas sp.]MBJ7318272.1 AAA family ATPase [Brevundimonas sp.]